MLGNLFFNFNGLDPLFSASFTMFALHGSSTLSLDSALNDVWTVTIAVAGVVRLRSARPSGPAPGEMSQANAHGLKS